MYQEKKMTQRDKVYCELIKFDRRVWTVQDMKERVDVSEQTIRSVFHSLTAEGHMDHRDGERVYRLE